MFVSLSSAINTPIRRIYLIWGVMLLVGFVLSGYGIFDGYLHWYFLSLIGVLSQIIKISLKDKRAKILLFIWALIALGGTLLTHGFFAGFIEYPSYIPHIGMFWLALMSLPQIMTGFILKNTFQKILGVVWLVLAIILWNTTMDPLLSFYLIALISGLPYLYIAFKR